MTRSGHGVTIYEVAARAGVSISTVSLAINAPHRVRAATRERVMSAARDLGYRVVASTPRARSGTRLAVAAPFTSYPSYLRRLAGMLERCRDTAIELITLDIESAARTSTPLLDTLPMRHGIDGLIVMGAPLSGGALRTSRQAGLPVVLVDARRVPPSVSGPPTVLIDDLAGGRAIGRHLRDHGHRRAIYLHEPQMSGDYLSPAMLRVAGLEESIEVVDAVCVESADPAEVVAAAIAAHPSATAVVAHHDGFATAIRSRMRETARQQGRPIALVGYDDGPAAEVLGLTTVRQPFEESGAAAIDLMMSILIEGGRPPQQVMLEPRLVVRESG
ncbi:LacI family DNA-binding transcriptional regulator [Homoserinibacter sp. YIM 151385]|uniref:LacI family DNA-binding transcriptional regulator n=1 Tax=Homoserinibacter sp. YIM 151385 TaxID=2985506 RepID=UPI0022F05E95|nr:LacI family DNA-binding transcriptional regulator [Homoserinibacter sp. YIM 151385]WBU37498.1 LacI family DNA-binding transcriptional regulator [Homoserinibacter sp. YIM 151385]